MIPEFVNVVILLKTSMPKRLSKSTQLMDGNFKADSWGPLRGFKTRVKIAKEPYRALQTLSSGLKAWRRIYT